MDPLRDGSADLAIKRRNHYKMLREKKIALQSSNYKLTHPYKGGSDGLAGKDSTTYRLDYPKRDIDVPPKFVLPPSKLSFGQEGLAGPMSTTLKDDFPDYSTSVQRPDIVKHAEMKADLRANHFDLGHDRNGYYESRHKLSFRTPEKGGAQAIADVELRKTNYVLGQDKLTYRTMMRDDFPDRPYEKPRGMVQFPADERFVMGSDDVEWASHCKGQYVPYPDHEKVQQLDKRRFLKANFPTEMGEWKLETTNRASYLPVQPPKRDLGLIEARKEEIRKVSIELAPKGNTTDYSTTSGRLVETWQKKAAEGLSTTTSYKPTGPTSNLNMSEFQGSMTVLTTMQEANKDITEARKHAPDAGRAAADKAKSLKKDLQSAHFSFGIAKPSLSSTTRDAFHPDFQTAAVVRHDNSSFLRTSNICLGDDRVTPASLSQSSYIAHVGAQSAKMPESTMKDLRTVHYNIGEKSEPMITMKSTDFPNPFLSGGKPSRIVGNGKDLRAAHFVLGRSNEIPSTLYQDEFQPIDHHRLYE